MSKEDNIVLDGGYGLIGNMAKHMFFKYVLDEEGSKEYRRKLEKENPIAYSEYLEYERMLDNDINGI